MRQRGKVVNFNTMTAKDKPTSAPLPRAHDAKDRADALRGNLAKRKAQARARDAGNHPNTKEKH